MKTTHSIITALETRIAAELTAVNREQVFRDMLDETSEEISCAGITCSPSRFVETLDPVAFRCGVADYFGTSDGYVEDVGEAYGRDEAEQVKQDMVDELQGELRELEGQLKVGADETPVDESSQGQIQDEIDAKQAEINALEGHSF